MANPARTPDPRLDPTDPDRPSTDPLAPDPRLSPANSQTVNRFESRTGGTGILIAAVVLVLALIAYFAFAPGDDTTVAPDGSAVTDTAPAPDATAPAAPSDTAPAPDATAPAAPSDSTAPAPSDSTTAPAPDATAPAPAPAPAQ